MKTSLLGEAELCSAEIIVADLGSIFSKTFAEPYC